MANPARVDQGGFAPPLLFPITRPEPRVSVLVPNYNFGRFIIEAVNSALSQSYGNLEIIICDDGSTDDSIARIKANFSDNPRVIYFTQANAGQAAAFNSAFARASGDLIALLDADDLWLTNRLRRVVDRFQALPGLGLLSHRLQVVDKTVKKFGRIVPSRLDEGWLGWDPIAVAKLGKAPSSGLTIHRQVAERVFPIPTGSQGNGDGIIARRAAVLATIGAIDDALALYRQHGGNQGGATWPTRSADAEALLARHRIAIEDHVAFYGTNFNRPAGDSDFVRKATAESELINDLLAGRVLDRRLICELDRSRTRFAWHLLAKLPRSAAIALYRLRQNHR
jgi:glycosyltransferase involved in cell wall biosynthesis